VSLLFLRMLSLLVTVFLERASWVLAINQLFEFMLEERGKPRLILSFNFFHSSATPFSSINHSFYNPPILSRQTTAMVRRLIYIPIGRQRKWVCSAWRLWLSAGRGCGGLAGGRLCGCSKGRFCSRLLRQGGKRRRFVMVKVVFNVEGLEGVVAVMLWEVSSVKLFVLLAVLLFLRLVFLLDLPPCCVFSLSFACPLQHTRYRISSFAYCSSFKFLPSPCLTLHAAYFTDQLLDIIYPS